MSVFNFMKPRYEKIIIESGFDDLIKFNNLHNQGGFTGQKIVRSDKEIIRQKLINKTDDTETLTKKITKLQQLKNDLKEENFSKKKNIFETIDYLITIFNNLKENNEELGEGYAEGGYLPEYTINGIDAICIISNGDIHFLNEESYELLLTIPNDNISHIEYYSEEEEQPAYIPKYKDAPKAPSAVLTNQTWNNKSTDKYMQNYYKNEYERKLAEYQADLISTNAYNQNEQKKYQESLGKTRKKRYIDICFKSGAPIERLTTTLLLGDYYIKQKLPMIDIKDLDKGTIISGKKNDKNQVYKPVEKIKIGNEDLCYINVAKNLYISHNIKDNVLELKVADGHHIVITKYENVDFKQMAKKLKSESRIGKNGEKAFNKAEFNDGATRFWGMLDNPNDTERSIFSLLMEYKNFVYEIKETYEEEYDKYIDYDEEIDGELALDERSFGALDASMSIVKNTKS